MWTRRREEKDDAYYDELIKQRIGEAIRSHMDDEKLDRAVLDAWIEEDNRKRAARRKRYMAVAACVLVLCIGTFGIKMILETEDTVAVAGKGDDVVNESGNNVVIKNNREDVEENIGGEEIVVKSWEKVLDLQKEYEDMMIPGYVPEGYEFSKLEIMDNGVATEYAYIFNYNTVELRIEQIMGIDSVTYYEYDRVISDSSTDLMIKEDSGKCGFCKIKNGAIYIYSDCSDNDMLKIINAMKREN